MKVVELGPLFQIKVGKLCKIIADISRRATFNTSLNTPHFSIKLSYCLPIRGKLFNDNL
jgi:hypothetical protein